MYRMTAVLAGVCSLFREHIQKWLSVADGGKASRFYRGVALLWVSTHVLAKFRLLPDAMLRAIFTAHLLESMVASNVLIRWLQCLRCLRLIPQRWTPRLCAMLTAVCCRWSRIASPHVTIRLLPGSLPSFTHMQSPNVVLVNHSSFLDSILFMWVVNPTYMLRMKTLYMAKLASVPLLGTIIKSSEMLPVYFVSSDGGEFRVEKEKQAKVLELTEQHLAGGGSISFFPEGAINRSNVKELQPFRIGSFKKVLEHKLNVYFMLTIGADVVWRRKESVGGHAGTIYIYYGKIDVDYNDPDLDAERLAQQCQAHMQQQLDAMYRQVATL